MTDTHSLNVSEPGIFLPDTVRALVRDSLAPGTQLGYRHDVEHFVRWGGTIPAGATVIAQYIADLSTTYKPATIGRRLAALSKAHEARGLNNPCRSELVKATMRGVRRTLGMAQRQARPLLRDDLVAILAGLDAASIKDTRDRALLLLGFAGAFRRSELAALDHDDVVEDERGLVVTIRRSKTDQEGRGRQVAIPRGRTRHCPVRALHEWLCRAHIVHGPIFRRINKHGHLLPNGISGEAVSFMLKARLNAAGYDATGFSAHSLRAGFCTSAAQAGAPNHKIRQVTGHASDAMLARYIRDVDLFTDPAAALLL